MKTPPRIAVMGPTGAGKSAFAEALADRFDAVLINADAFQVYRGLDIGTAKPDRRELYRLLDLVDPNEAFGVGEWVRLASAELRSAYEAGRPAVVVGGTGLYVRALFEGYADLAPEPDPALRAELMRREREDGLASLVADLKARAPEVAARVDLRNPVRVRRALEKLESPAERIVFELPDQPSLKLAIEAHGAEYERRLLERVRSMVAAGWLEEVRGLVRNGAASDSPGFRAIGYQTIGRVNEGRLTVDEAVEEIWRDTRRYAKRQRTWLKAEPNLERYACEGKGDSGWREAFGRAAACIEVF